MRQRTVKLNYTETNDQIPIFISNVTFYMLHVLVFIREAQPFNGHFQVYWGKLEMGETPAECSQSCRSESGNSVNRSNQIWQQTMINAKNMYKDQECGNHWLYFQWLSRAFPIPRLSRAEILNFKLHNFLESDCTLYIATVTPTSLKYRTHIGSGLPKMCWKSHKVSTTV